MSLKSVELQIAVHRTNEAGRMQQEYHQRPSQDQAFLSAEENKQSREASQRSAEVDETAESAVRDDGSSRSHHQLEQEKNRTGEQETSQPADHPYKGHHLDISL
ncbi:hypothetical protein [Paenibacillus lemnae]|uniref:Uncharacterized protein n=1 Tax=Paenibacillus lemnae TaxID=1330551 RepID=A0A848M617_PAELE|nr:hypothetical protein [Paenibacillus lemnae]NMO96185.1 hypothetical protein [Paenibacillus lemnae]